MAESNAPQPDAPPRRRRWAKRLSWLVGVLVALGVLGIGGLWYVTRSEFIVARVAPHLAERLGGRVIIDRAQYQGRGVFVFNDVVLRGKGASVRGDAGQIARLGRAELTLDMARLFRGKVKILDVTLDDVVLRLSEQKDAPGRFNFMTLTPDWEDDGDDGPVEPPRVAISGARFEFGSHEAGVFDLHTAREVTGLLDPEPVADDANDSTAQWYAFSLKETGEDGDAAVPLDITGRWNPATNALETELAPFELDARVEDALPMMAQQWWREMALEGRVSMAVVWPGRGDAPLQVEFRVEDVAFTLPIEGEDVGLAWALYKDGAVTPSQSQPRLKADHGVIRLSHDQLELEEIRGSLVSSSGDVDLAPVPYEINGRWWGLPVMGWQDAANREQWSDEVLAQTPFTITVEMNEFSTPSAVELPRPVADVLAKFQLRDWSLSTEVTIERREAADGPGAVGMRGQAFISRASGAYHKFPYPIEDVEAYMHFTNEVLTIEYLNATGSGGAALHLDGTITPPGRDAAVSLTLEGDGIPIDDDLRQALKPKHQRAIDKLLDRAAYESLRTADLIPGPDDLEATHAALARLIDSGEGGSDTAQRMRAILAQGPFELGGTIDLALIIDRPAGHDMDTTLSGLVNLDNVGVVFEKFPYPFTITSGALEIDPRQIRLRSGNSARDQVDGLQLVTTSGGRGVATGTIDMVRRGDGTTSADTNLRIAVTNDQHSPLVEAAIPLTDDERARLLRVAADVETLPVWPGHVRARSAEILRSLGLTGRLDYSGDIITPRADPVQMTAADDPPTTFAFDLQVSRGALLAPEDAQFGDTVDSIRWPAGLSLRNVTSSWIIADDRVEMRALRGERESGAVDAVGAIHFGGDAPARTTLDVSLTQFPLEDSLIEAAPPDLRDRVQPLWKRYQPRGTFDATLTYRDDGRGAQPVEIVATPREFAFRVDGVQIQLEDPQGALRISESGVSLTGAQGELMIDERSAGAIQVDASVGFASNDAGPITVAGSWRGGQFESPIVNDLLDQLPTPRPRGLREVYKPRGTFDAVFAVERDTGGDVEFDVDISPRDLHLQLGGHPLHLQCDEPALVEITPRAVTLVDFSGQHGAGRFQIAGDVSLSTRRVGDLRLDIDGVRSNPALADALPQAVRDAFTALTLDTSGGEALRDARLQFTSVEGEDGAAVYETVRFVGSMDVTDASFLAGVEFTDVRGTFDIDLDYDHEQGTALTIDAACPTLRAIGQSLRQASARLSKTRAADALTLERLDADLHGGTLWADGTIGVAENLDYAVKIEVVEAGLDGIFAAGEVDPDAEPAAAPEGKVYGELRLAGQRGDPSTKRGRGMVRIMDGAVGDIPLALQMAQVLQLTVPANSAMNYANSEFYIAGDTLHFESILLESSVASNALLQVMGEGTMDLTTFELDTRFRQRSGFLLVRDLFGGLSDTLYRIDVGGTLRVPEVRIVPLPGLATE